MLVEKEIISPGQYWYTDEATGLPRKLDVTSELTKYWCEQGSAMLSSGLTVPVPYEHDFNIHPMTPKDKLLNNAGEVKEYRIKDAPDGRKDVLFGVVDVQDPAARSKIGHNIRWTSPWINSFTDGNGRTWNNVISHLALTTRPRITRQAPFSSIAAAMSLGTEVKISTATPLPTKEGVCLSRAGRLVRRKKDKKVCPLYPIAFSMFSGASLAEDDFPPKKKKDKNKSTPDKDKAKKPESQGGKPDANPTPGEEGKKPPDTSVGDEGGDEFEDMENMDGSDVSINQPPAAETPGAAGQEPFNDQPGDVSMEEILCDLLGALGIHCEKTGNEDMFKRSLYNAAMTKIHELTSKGMNDLQDPNRTNPPGQPPNNPQPGTPPPGQPNPLIQQEQQPMYMSLEEINKLPDPMKSVALSMYNENVRLRAEMDVNAKTANSLRDSKLKEELAKRQTRVAILSKLSPRVKTDLEAMAALPSMALSMGEGGAVVDPMAQTLAVLEKGLSDIPRLLTTDHTALSVQPQPTDSDMTDEQTDKLADDMARMMGCPPVAKTK